MNTETEINVPAGGIVRTLCGMTQQEWNDRFHYGDGKLYWREEASKAKAGKVAGFKHPSGWMLTQKGVHVPRKDAVWFFANGYVPADKKQCRVARLNGDKWDDHLENLTLKEVTPKSSTPTVTTQSSEPTQEVS